jgi:hypothetical protein
VRITQQGFANVVGCKPSVSSQNPRTLEPQNPRTLEPRALIPLSLYPSIPLSLYPSIPLSLYPSIPSISQPSSPRLHTPDSPGPPDPSRNHSNHEIQATRWALNPSRRGSTLANRSALRVNQTEDAQPLLDRGAGDRCVCWQSVVWRVAAAARRRGP